MNMADDITSPHYAVIFTSMRTAIDGGYDATAEEMVRLARQQPGFLGVDNARGSGGLGITVSYWRDLESIQAWRNHLDHARARSSGRAQWYSQYELRVAKVERAYAWKNARGPGADL